MNEEHEDEIDKMLYDYFEQHKPKVDASTKKAIATAFDKEKEKKHKKIHSFSILTKVATVVITFTVFFSGISFAGDLWKVINLIFTNSNEAINKAVENGYVQKVDMDFIENNDVKVKIDYILLDDKNLNISFVSQYKEEVEEISLNNITVTNEKGEKVANITEEGVEREGLDAKIVRTASREKIDDNMLKESIHIILEEDNFPISKQLFIKVDIANVKIKNQEKIIQGTWNMIINLDKKFSQR